MYVGELVFTYLYDLGGEIRLQEAARLLARMPEAVRVEPRKSAPPYVALARPLLFRYPTRTIDTDRGVLQADFEARVYAIGAIGISVRVPFELPSMEAVNDLTYVRLPDGYSFEALAKGLANEIEASLREALVETYTADVEPEAYLVIALTQTSRPAMELFEKERQTLAGLLAGEKRPERLSDEEARDNLRTWYRYYEDDLVVVDWDRALIIEPSGKYDDVLAVMEAANLELLELRVYDKYLDDVLEAAYEDISRFYGRGGLFRSARGVQEDLSDARIDLVRVTDTINNIGKIFGDYYLAKLHLGLAERFHLKEWETIVREKMATLNELYTLASHEVEHRRGVVLEGMIVLLFIVDLVLIYLVSGA
ncbi:MAG TPA: hypothetical protein VFH78_14455 [Candidatus Thermoplasmatota archaeon]|nr:hypothetical protein [Candidatus Thermoplasmatota archaeon]